MVLPPPPKPAASRDAAPDELQQLGARVRRLRTELGMQQEDLATATGLARPTISKLERGLQNVTVTTLHRLAHALNVSAADLLKSDAES